MRWFFLLLLVLNLAFISWQVLAPVPESSVYAAPLKNVPSIVLLEEQSRSDESVSEKKVVHHENLEKITVDEKDVSPTEVNVIKKGSENIVVAEISAQVTDVPKSEVMSQVGSCYTLGPFRELDELRKLTQQLKPHVIATDFRGKEEKERAIYWVYIEPESSYKSAVVTGKRLKSKKIKDFYIIRDGEKINGLSLGHFRNKKGAYGLARKVKNLGFNVVIEPVVKTFTAYWLDYQLDNSGKVPESIIVKYNKSVKKNKISRLKRDCAV